jgi:hypothetical protein
VDGLSNTLFWGKTWANMSLILDETRFALCVENAMMIRNHLMLYGPASDHEWTMAQMHDGLQKTSYKIGS